MRQVQPRSDPQPFSHADYPTYGRLSEWRDITDTIRPGFRVLTEKDCICCVSHGVYASCPPAPPQILVADWDIYYNQNGEWLTQRWTFWRCTGFSKLCNHHRLRLPNFLVEWPGPSRTGSMSFAAGFILEGDK